MPASACAWWEWRRVEARDVRSMSPPAATALPTPGLRSRLLTNTGWNIAGQVVPLAVGLAVLPLLIRAMGLDRYGFLTLVWVLVGYASIFDFGISRALVRVVAARLARGEETAAHHVAQVGMGYLALLGVAIGGAFFAGSQLAVDHLFKLPAALSGEALHAMWLLAASLPFVMLTTGYAGVLSAHQQFRTLNVLRAGMGIANYGAPLLVALWLNRLDAIVASVLVLRVVATVVHAVVARRACRFRSQPTWLDRPTSVELFAVGGWMSVSNIVSPLMSYLDRLLLSALVPMRAVAFYSVPFDLTSKAMIIPYSMIAAVFPSAAALEPGSDAARRMLTRSVRLLFVLFFPLVFTLMAVAEPGLRLWLGSEFAQQAAPVLQVLALAVLLNALAQGPAMLIQAAGRPKLMAVLHLVELPIFVAVLYALTREYGIVGTAAAAALRNGLDALAVWALARSETAPGPIAWRAAAVPCLLASVLLPAAVWQGSGLASVGVLLGGLTAYGIVAWRRLLSPSERSVLRSSLGFAA